LHFQFDLGLKPYLAEITRVQPDHVLVSTPEWAFRTNIQKFKDPKGLSLPFVAFRPKPGGIRKPDNAYKNWAITEGLWFEDVQERVGIYAVEVEYSCVFWCNDYTQAAAMYQLRHYDLFRENFVPYKYVIFDRSIGKGREFEFEMLLDYTNLELDPEYSDAEELRRGNLHSVDMSFKVLGYVLQDRQTAPAEAAVFEDFYSGGFEDPAGDPLPPDYDSLVDPDASTITRPNP